MAFLIDACVLIEAERGRLDLQSRVLDRAESGVFISAITASELLHGVHRAADAGQRARRAAFVEAVLDRFDVLGVDLPTARVHARLWADLAANGVSVGAHDLWLAATCVARGLTMVTANARDFVRVPGLDLEVWVAGS